MCYENTDQTNTIRFGTWPYCDGFAGDGGALRETCRALSPKQRLGTAFGPGAADGKPSGPGPIASADDDYTQRTSCPDSGIPTGRNADACRPATGADFHARTRRDCSAAAASGGAGPTG